MIELDLWSRMKEAIMPLRAACRRHAAVLILAFFVSGIYGSHHIFISRILKAEGDRYRPLTFAAHADMSVYGIRANAVYTGQWLAGDISTPEYSGDPSSLPLLNPLLMGGLGRVLGSLDRAVILSDFLFPPIIFIVLYFIAFELTGARALAALFATFFIFIPKAILYLPPVSGVALQALLQQILPDDSWVLYFVRFEYPKITFLFFAPALYGTFRAIRREGERWSVWLAGVCFGLMFYTYLYDWVYFFISLSLTGAMLAFSGKYRECGRLAKIAGIGFALSAPYWYNFFLLRQLPQYQDIAGRIGVETGRFFRWASVWKGYLRIAVLTAALAWLIPKREQRTLWYLAGLLLAYVAAVNIQALTGFNPHPDHWYRVSFLPLALAMLAAGYWTARRFLPGSLLAYGGILAVVSVGLLFGRSLASQYAYAKKDAQYYVVAGPYAAAYAWLADHAPPRSLVASIDILTNNELTLYTPQRTFLLNGLHTTAGDAAIWQRFMETATAFSIRPEIFSARINDDATLFYLFLNEYGDQSFDAAFRNDAGSQRRVPDETVTRMSAAYARIRTEQEAEDIVAGVDYVLVGPREEAALHLETEFPSRNSVSTFTPLKNMEKVYDSGGVRIYQIIKK